MGLECTKGTRKDREWLDHSGGAALEEQIRSISDQATFMIKIDNLRLLNFSQTFHFIRVEIPPAVTVDFTSQNFTKQGKIWTSQQTFHTQITAPLNQIAQKTVLISILNRKGDKLDQLNLKLYHLSTGPSIHDHLLQNLHSRLLFDFHIEQRLELSIGIRDFSLNWKEPLYSQDSYLLELMIANAKENICEGKRFEQHWKIKEYSLHPIHTFCSKLHDSTVKLKLTLPTQMEHHLEFYLPFSKIIEHSTYRLVTTQRGCFQNRDIQRHEDIIINGQNVGELDFTLSINKSRLYMTQLDCVILSQNGIVLTTASEQHGREQQLNGQTIRRYLMKLRNAKSQGISDYQFMKTMDELYQILKGDSQFHVGGDFFQVQSLVLDFLIQLQQCLEEDKVVKNQIIWKIINLILHKKLMSLRYYGSIRDPKLQKQYALKYYTFLDNTLVTIIQFILHGINYKELASLQKFVAYAFFRSSWCQNQIIQALKKPTDPVLSQERVVEIGASTRGRSPSKSALYDWETNMLNLIRKEEAYLELTAKLQRAVRANPKWAALLFDRQYQQLFYGLFSEVWDEAQIFLFNNGRIMWQYFPRYSQLLSIFLGEMNQNEIMQFSQEMTQCNMKLIKNEKLLNTFMTLVFPKTCLYQSYSVLKCLDLINCYFATIVENGKKIPSDFQYNYFYTGVKCILESSHSILIQVMLSTLYKYYHIFSREFRKTLNHYITRHAFNGLFLHWSPPVRSIFHFLVAHRITKFKEQENPERQTRTNVKGSFGYETSESSAQIVNSILKRLKEEQTERPINREEGDYLQRMKKKILQKRMEKKMIESRISFISCGNLDSPTTKLRLNSEDNISSMASPRRKWSLTGSCDDEGCCISDREMNYLSISLSEYDQAKREINPDEIVEARSKLLQLNVDQ